MIICNPSLHHFLTQRDIKTEKMDVAKGGYISSYNVLTSYVDQYEKRIVPQCTRGRNANYYTVYAHEHLVFDSEYIIAKVHARKNEALSLRPRLRTEKSSSAK